MTSTKTPLDAAAELSALGISWSTVAKLAEPTPKGEVRQRQGPGGKMLDYVDARYVMKALDAVCGPYWQRDHRMDGAKVSCGIGILIDGVWVWRWDGAGETDIEGEKGSFSDAFKRAGVNWGIARDLYPDAQGASPPARPRQADEGRGLYRPSPAPLQDEFGNECSEHHRTWTLKPAGTSKRTGKPYPAFYACDGKTNGIYCQRKPSQTWLDAQENH